MNISKKRIIFEWSLWKPAFLAITRLISTFRLKVWFLWWLRKIIFWTKKYILPTFPKILTYRYQITKLEEMSYHCSSILTKKVYKYSFFLNFKHWNIFHVVITTGWTWSFRIQSWECNFKTPKTHCKNTVIKNSNKDKKNNRTSLGGAHRREMS